MANITTASATPSTLSRLFGAIGDFFVSMADAQSRSAQFNALNDLSDQELADIGLGRHEIAQHVFRDKMFM